MISDANPRMMSSTVLNNMMFGPCLDIEPFLDKPLNGFETLAVNHRRLWPGEDSIARLMDMWPRKLKAQEKLKRWILLEAIAMSELAGVIVLRDKGFDFVKEIDFVDETKVKHEQLSQSPLQYARYFADEHKESFDLVLK